MRFPLCAWPVGRRAGLGATDLHHAHVVVCVMLLMPVALSAQEGRAWPDRVVVSINVPFQTLGNDFAETLRFADTVRTTESVVFAAAYDSTKGALFDVGGGLRVVGDLGIGVAVSRSAHTSASAFELRVPNPIVANAPLGLAGSVSDLSREELGVHLQALYAVGVGQNVRVVLAGGPSIFDTTFDLVRSLDFFQLPGFTGLQFDEALVTQVGRTVVGFNISADITWALTSHFGFGTLVRYSRADVTLDPGSASGLTRAIATHAGGLHVGAGIRLLF